MKVITFMSVLQLIMISFELTYYKSETHIAAESYTNMNFQFNWLSLEPSERLKTTSLFFQQQETL